MVFPAQTVGVVPIVNLGTDSHLVLTPEIINRILVKNITSWADPSIVQLNVILTPILEAAGKITTVVRSDGSGSTTIFCVGMSRLVPNFENEVNCSAGYMTYRDVGERIGDEFSYLNTGVLDRVRSTHGAFGYVSSEDITMQSFTNISSVVLLKQDSRQIVQCTTSR